MSFLRLFGFSSPASTPSIAEPALTRTIDPLTDSERLSRYVTSKDHFSVVKNEVHFRAFLPRRNDGELSIMRTKDLDEAGVWTLGDAVAAPAQRTVYARGDFLAPDVRASFVDRWHLSVRLDEAPPRHALIEGWPPQTETEIRKLLAVQLRAKAALIIRPVPTVE